MYTIPIVSVDASAHVLANMLVGSGSLPLPKVSFFLLKESNLTLFHRDYFSSSILKTWRI